jgi:transposase
LKYSGWLKLTLKIMKLSPAHELQLRSALTETKDLRVYRRAIALLALHEGLPPRRVAKLLGASRQTIHNWIAAYGRDGVSFDLADSPRSGRPSLWTDDLRRFVQETITQPPGQAGFPSEHWTAKMLREHLMSAREKTVSKEALRQCLHSLGYKWKNGRYVLRMLPGS